MSVAQLKDRVDLLCQLIRLECVSAVNAGPSKVDAPVYADLMAIRQLAIRARETWAGAVLPIKLGPAETAHVRRQRARLLEALSDTASMGAYGAPVELGPIASGPMFTMPAGWTVTMPERFTVAGPGFDREAFRRDTAARMLETEKGRYGIEQDAQRAVALADALLAALEAAPRGT